MGEGGLGHKTAVRSFVIAESGSTVAQVYTRNLGLGESNADPEVETVTKSV